MMAEETVGVEPAREGAPDVGDVATAWESSAYLARLKGYEKAQSPPLGETLCRISGSIFEREPPPDILWGLPRGGSQIARDATVLRER